MHAQTQILLDPTWFDIHQPQLTSGASSASSPASSCGFSARYQYLFIVDRRLISNHAHLEFRVEAFVGWC